MAKKTATHSKGILSALTGGLLGKVQAAAIDVTEAVKNKVYEAIARFIQELCQLFFLIIAMVFIFVGIAFVVNEHWIASKGLSFVVVGFAVMILLLIYRSMKQNR